METWLVIGISGVTNGGKTTLARKLEAYFTEHQSQTFFKENITLHRVVSLSQDDYFLPQDSPRHTLIEKLNHINWEILSSLDMDRMCRDIMTILGTRFILYQCPQTQQETDGVPSAASFPVAVEDNMFADHQLGNFLAKYDDENGYGNGCSARTTNLIKKSKNESFRNLSVKLNVLLLEGFLLFNHPFTVDLCTVKFHLHLPYEKCYARRMQRVYDPPDVVGYFEMCVWPLYERHYKEFKDRTDIVVLNGDIPQTNIVHYVLNCIKNFL